MANPPQPQTTSLLVFAWGRKDGGPLCSTNPKHFGISKAPNPKPLNTKVTKATRPEYCTRSSLLDEQQELQHLVPPTYTEPQHKMSRPKQSD